MKYSQSSVELIVYVLLVLIASTAALSGKSLSSPLLPEGKWRGISATITPPHIMHFLSPAHYLH
jgi:hypothetical protein